MTLSFSFLFVFLAMALKDLTFRFGRGTQKLTSLVSRRCLTNVSSCSQPFSVLLSKLSAMLVGKSTKIEQFSSCFIRERVGHCIRCKAVDQLLNISSSLRTLVLEDSLRDAPTGSSATTAYVLFSDNVIAAPS